MVRWRDLGAGLAAAPRVLLSGKYWSALLARLLFSRVFAGYALVAALLYAGARSMLSNVRGDGTGMMLVIVAALGPALLALLFALLLPYALWAINPAAARTLPRFLPLPPRDEDGEPGFVSYLAWCVPVMVLAVLLTALTTYVPAFHDSDVAPWFGYASALLVALSLLKPYTRAALAVHYARDDIDTFLHATRWQRRLLWLPVVLALGWAGNLLVALVLRGSGLLGPHGLPTSPAAVPVAIALAMLVSLALGIFYVAVLMHACGRAAAPASSHTMSMDTQGEWPAASAPGWPPRRRAWGAVATLALVALPAGAWWGREPLLDLWLGRQESHQDALLAAGSRFAYDGATGVLLDPAQAVDRLRAGYVVHGCIGDLAAARWIERVGAVSAFDRGRLLTCAACEGRRETVDWVLASLPAVELNGVSMRAAHGGPRQRTTALACAASRNDLALARQLVTAGARPGNFAEPLSPLQQAIAKGHWDMARLLANRYPQLRNAALRPALEQARARGQRPAELVPRLVRVGIALDQRDEHGRNPFHWAAQRHDLGMVQALLAEKVTPGFGAGDADLQGVLPWMLVLRKAELDGQVLGDEALELLRLLAPPGTDVNIAAGHASPVNTALLPAGWNAGQATLNQPAARGLLGPGLDHGRLPDDAATWWKFGSAHQAEEFVRSATVQQLERAENPEAPDGLPPKKLSVALREAGWEALAEELQQKLRQPAPVARRR